MKTALLICLLFVSALAFSWVDTPDRYSRTKVDVTYQAEMSYTLVFDDFVREAMINPEGKKEPYNWKLFEEDFYPTNRLAFNSSSDAYLQLARNLFYKAKTGELRSWYPNALAEMSDKEIPQNEMIKYLNRKYQINGSKQDKGLPPRTVDDSFDADDIRSLSFCQEWFYDQKKHQLQVRPVTTSLNTIVIQGNSQYRGIKPRMYLRHHPASDGYGSEAGKKLHSDEVTWAGKVSLNTAVGETGAVSFPEYSRLVYNSAQDPKKMANWGFESGEQIQLESLKSVWNKELGQLLFEEALAGSVKVYEDEALRNSWTTEQFKEALIVRDTAYREKPDGELEEFVMTSEIKPYDVDAIKVRQQLSYDFKKNRLKSEITAVGLLKVKYDDYLKIEGFDPIVWVAFED